MEVHQSLPSHYLHNPYLVKSEHAPSDSPPPNDSHTVSARRQTAAAAASTTTTTTTTAASAASSRPASSAMFMASSPCSSSERGGGGTLYTTSNNRAGVVTNNLRPTSSNISQNGRPLTADRKRPYSCNMCSSRFGSKMELEEHQNSHTGQKPFECNMCKARFNRRSTLWNHKRIHSDDKPFECTVCRMTFKWKNSLKCHREMHQRKNEISGAENDPLEKTLTYATAAKRRHLEVHHDLSSSPSSGRAASSGHVESSVVALLGNSSGEVQSLPPARKRNTAKSSSRASAITDKHHFINGTVANALMINNNGLKSNLKNINGCRSNSNKHCRVSATIVTNRNSNNGNNNSNNNQHNNNNNNNNNIDNNNSNNSTESGTHSLASATDAFIHTPLHAEDLFNNQKALSISDHKELDSLLNGTTRLTTMLKDDGIFKTNLCDDLASIGNQSSVFDSKQEMNIFHSNPFMVFGTHQLQTSVQNFTPQNLAFGSPNGGSCSDYFHAHLNQAEQLNVTGSGSLDHDVSHVQYSTSSSSSSTPNDLLMGHNHNVITYQTQLDTSSILSAPTLDYAVTPSSLDYMMNGSYSTNTISGDISAQPAHIHYASHGDDVIGSKEISRVSW